MWITLLVMALAVSFEPFRLGMTVLMLNRPRPQLQLLAFLCGGFVMGTTVGLVVLFTFRHVSTGSAQFTLPRVQIGIGVAALLVAALLDPDPSVVREASFGLTVLSRKPSGLIDAKGKPLPIEPLDGLEEDASEDDVQAQLQKWAARVYPAWKKWYLAVRPYEERDDRLELHKKPPR